MTGGAPRSARESLIWTVLILGLAAVTVLAVRSFFRSGGTSLESLGPVPTFALTDQTEALIEDGDLRNRVWVADFMFTRCRGICPILTNRFQEIQKRLHDVEDWSLVSFSVDPEHDTPEVLAAYAADHEADPNRWRFLTGDKETVHRLVIEGFHLAVDEDVPNATEPILHSRRLILVDREGFIRGYYDALDEASMEQLPRDILRLLEEGR